MIKCYSVCLSADVTNISFFIRWCHEVLIFCSVISLTSRCFSQTCRWKVTSKDTLLQISEYSEAGVTIRGVYIPPGKQPGEDERKLYLAIEGTASLSGGTRQWSDLKLGIGFISKSDTLSPCWNFLISAQHCVLCVTLQLKHLRPAKQWTETFF